MKDYSMSKGFIPMLLPGLKLGILIQEKIVKKHFFMLKERLVFLCGAQVISHFQDANSWSSTPTGSDWLVTVDLDLVEDMYVEDRQKHMENIIDFLISYPEDQEVAMYLFLYNEIFVQSDDEDDIEDDVQLQEEKLADDLVPGCEDEQVVDSIVEPENYDRMMERHQREMEELREKHNSLIDNGASDDEKKRLYQAESDLSVKHGVELSEYWKRVDKAHQEALGKEKCVSDEGPF